MFMLLWGGGAAPSPRPPPFPFFFQGQACGFVNLRSFMSCTFVNLLSFMSFGHTHTHTHSIDSNTCENSYAHAALGERRCALLRNPPLPLFPPKGQAYAFVNLLSFLFFCHTYVCNLNWEQYLPLFAPKPGMCICKSTIRHVLLITHMRIVPPSFWFKSNRAHLYIYYPSCTFDHACWSLFMIS